MFVFLLSSLSLIEFIYILLEIHCYACVQSFYLLENKLGYFRLTKELENNLTYISIISTYN